MNGPPRGAVLRLEPVNLPAVSDQLIGTGGSGPERERWKRDNRARRCWRLVDLDGADAGGGLFVSVEHAEEYARQHGWTVLPVPVDGDRATSGGLRA